MRCRRRLRFDGGRDRFSRRLLVLVFLQRGHRDLRVARVGAMHRFAVMAQRLLRKPLRITRHLRAFSPRITIRVERHALDAQAGATLLELGSPVAGAHTAQVGKERPRGGQLAQQRRHFVAEVQARHRLGLLTAVTHHSLVPGNVLGIELGDVTLRPSQQPAQFVEPAAFGIAFALDDALVFVPSDRALGPVFHFRPPLFGEHGPGQPAHVEREVVNAPQVNVGGHPAALQHAQEVVRLRLEHRQLADAFEGVIFAGDLPARLGDAGFEFDDFRHHALPGAAGDLGIADGEVSAGDLTIDQRLLMRFVLGVQEAAGLAFISGLEACALVGVAVEQVENAALAAIHSESCVHDFFHERKNATIRNPPLTSSESVLASSGRVMGQ